MISSTDSKSGNDSEVQETRGLPNEEHNEYVHKPVNTRGDDPKILAYSFGHFLNDNTPMPEDLIAPRVLTPGDMLVFGGAAKVGKSDFMLALLMHMAGGVPFLGMKPPRPLKIYYLQAEVEYYTLRKRIRAHPMDQNLFFHFFKNVVFTPQLSMILDEEGVEIVRKSIINHFGEQGPDIIVIDPIMKFFDGGAKKATENDDSAMLFFLRNRLEALRDSVNPEAGLILVHDTPHVSKAELEEDPFEALFAVSSLRTYPPTGMVMVQPRYDDPVRKLYFELNYGPDIRPKTIVKLDGVWQEEVFHGNSGA